MSRHPAPKPTAAFFDRHILPLLEASWASLISQWIRIGKEFVMFLAMSLAVLMLRRSPAYAADNPNATLPHHLGFAWTERA